MLYHVRRLRADVQGLLKWLAAFAAVTLIISVGTTYFAVFSAQYVKEGTLAPGPPREPLGFLRVVDPDESLEHIAVDDGSSFAMESVLDTPGLAVLLEQIGLNDDMFLMLPLGALTTNLHDFDEMAQRGRAVVAHGHEFLADATTSGEAPLLWGSMADAASGLTDSRLGPLAVNQVRGSPLSAQLVGGDGRSVNTGDQPLIQLSPSDAEDLGIYSPYTSTDVIQAFTCYCDATELVPIARLMTKAERSAGSGRVYYAIGYDGLIGPAERSATAVEVLSTGFAVATLASICCFGAMSGAMFWRHCRYVYSVERLHGASEFALHARQQMVVFAAITVPAVAGFLLVDAALRTSAPGLPWSPRGGMLLPIAALAIQVGVGARTAVKVHRLGRWSRRGAARG